MLKISMKIVFGYVYVYVTEMRIELNIKRFFDIEYFHP